MSTYIFIWLVACIHHKQWDKDNKGLIDSILMSIECQWLLEQGYMWSKISRQQAYVFIWGLHFRELWLSSSLLHSELSVCKSESCTINSLQFFGVQRYKKIIISSLCLFLICVNISLSLPAKNFKIAPSQTLTWKNSPCINQGYPNYHFGVTSWRKFSVSTLPKYDDKQNKCLYYIFRTTAN